MTTPSGRNDMSEEHQDHATDRTDDDHLDDLPVDDPEVEDGVQGGMNTITTSSGGGSGKANF
jgi:hypothetical protein